MSNEHKYFWEEAVAILRRLRIRTKQKYFELCNIDNRFSRTPGSFYRDCWVEKGKWPGFLGFKPFRTEKTSYVTWEEAAVAARKLGFATADDYKLDYETDPKLHSSPQKLYRYVWKKNGGWPGFLGTIGKKKRKKFYATWAEASAAARRLKFKTIREYVNGRKQDPRLHSKPNKLYAAEWKSNGGWKGFLGNSGIRKRQDIYPTWNLASAAAKKLGIKRSEDYSKVYKKDPKLPGNPNLAYEDVWQKNGRWAGFLGTRTKPNPDEKYATWEEASAAAKKIGFISTDDYNQRFAETDPKLPGKPSDKYRSVWKKNGRWIGYLGLKMVSPIRGHKYVTWHEASKAAQRLGIKNGIEYKRRYKSDPKLPLKPAQLYKIEWKKRGSMAGFLARIFSYVRWEEASAAARKLNIRTIKEYQKKHCLDPRLPSNPAHTYKSVWVKKGLWLGFLGKTKVEKYATWDEAVKAVRRLRITSCRDYQNRYRCDPKLPVRPYINYRNVWVLLGKWSGFIGRKSHFYSTWQEASKAAIALGIKTQKEYKQNYWDDPKLPSTPDVVYQSLWKVNGGYWGFLGKTKKYQSWSEAAKAARSLKIRNNQEYKIKYKLNPKLPACPDHYYKNDWKRNGCWNGFLGLTPKKYYDTWIEASTATITLGIKYQQEYRQRYKQDPRLPPSPDLVYKDVWVDNGRWLGFLGRTNRILKARK